jgi:hypothetical protein
MFLLTLSKKSTRTLRLRDYWKSLKKEITVEDDLQYYQDAHRAANQGLKTTLMEKVISKIYI